MWKGPYQSRAATNPVVDFSRVIRRLHIDTRGRGLVEITQQVVTALRAGAPSEGLCSLFLRHTSASLLVQENADPSARRDLEAWLDRLVPEDDPLYTHTAEGADDMPAHVKAMLTATSLAIPIVDGTLALGTWQGLYLWEHRRRPHRREIVLHVTE